MICISLLIKIHILMKCFIWRPPSLSELTPMIFNTGLTHLGLEASISCIGMNNIMHKTVSLVCKCDVRLIDTNI